MLYHAGYGTLVWYIIQRNPYEIVLKQYEYWDTVDMCPSGALVFAVEVVELSWGYSFIMKDSLVYLPISIVK